MSDPKGSWAGGLLVNEAWRAYEEGRYQQAQSAARRAVDAAMELDDVTLLVRGLRVEADSLTHLGDYRAALARYTRIMGLAEDPSTRDKLNGVRAAEVVAASYWSWVSCARYLSEIGVRDLFRVLDAGERWLVATGHQDWRAAILSERASVHRQLREMDEAVANAQEALAVKEQYRAAPGFTLSTHRSQLGDALRSAGRSAEAVPHYQAILADPAATTWGRDAAHIGLTWCSLDRRDFALAIQHARAAVQLAERLGDDALCVSLDALAAACRLAGDLAEAWRVAERYLEMAGRIGGDDRPYHAARSAVDVALDRGDVAAAARLLHDMERHATALDAAAAVATFADEVRLRRERLYPSETLNPSDPMNPPNPSGPSDGYGPGSVRPR